MFFPPLPVATGHPINTWLRRLRNSVVANKPIGENVTYTQNGWTTNPSYENTNIPMYWSGQFNDGASYTKGEVVYVENYKSYLSSDITGAVVAVDSLPGIYVCVYGVPMDISFNDFGELDPKKDVALISFITSQIKRETNVCYAPIYPHPDYSPVQLPTNAKQGKFWHLIAFAPTLANMCINGESTDMYINMAQSGSSAL